MDRLRSPGGCPWDAAQTHASLARYLVEECYEVLEAIETDDATLLREELGDLLLQVLFHARIAEEAPGGFGIDEVAGDLVDKLVRRHPHVFAGAVAGSAEELNETWEQRKVAEKGRTSALDGVPVAQPALALAAKLVTRARRHDVVPPLVVAPHDSIGGRLLALVEEAVAQGLDPETELRRVARDYRLAILAAESESEAEAEAEAGAGAGAGAETGPDAGTRVVDQTTNGYGTHRSYMEPPGSTGGAAGRFPETNPG